MKLSVPIICQDEEETLPFVLGCLVPLADIISEVVIVDGKSVDSTFEVIADYGTLLPLRFYSRVFDNFAAQKNYALERCRGEWVLGLDADHAFNSLTFKKRWLEGQHAGRDVWDIGLVYCKGDLRHWHKPSGFGATTRLWKNIGLRYEKPIHEYLVYPGQTGWSSIHNENMGWDGDELWILEMRMLKSDRGIEEWARRYQRFRQLELENCPLPDMSHVSLFTENRWVDAEPIPEKILAGVPAEVLSLPAPWTI